jgi:hypothetical protein
MMYMPYNNEEQTTVVIPICSSCKKLRTVVDEWIDSTEFYENADLSDIKRLSHGICPDCIKILYPEFALKRFPSNPAM